MNLLYNFKIANHIFDKETRRTNRSFDVDSFVQMLLEESRKDF